MDEDLRHAYEAFISEYAIESGQPTRVLAHRIARADVFVCIIGCDRGSDMPGDPEGRSVVEWELDCASQYRPRVSFWAFLPKPVILVYLKEQCPADGIDPRQSVFRLRVSSIHALWRHVFHSQDKLYRMLRNGLDVWRKWEARHERRCMYTLAFMMALEAAGSILCFGLSVRIPTSLIAVSLLLIAVSFLVNAVLVTWIISGWRPIS